MLSFRTKIGAALLIATASVTSAQPGSVESELKYAREYMDAGKWDYAMWRYEGILLKDPNNAEAVEGYRKAKAAHEAAEAAKRARAEQLMSPPRQQSQAVSPARKPKTKGATQRPTGAKAMCDAQFGTCQAINHSVAACAPRRAMCYTQNGVK